MNRFSIVAAALALLASCSQSDGAVDPITPQPQPETAENDDGLILPLPKQTSAEINEADLRQRIAILADDAFEGRAPAAPVGERTADWLAAEMQRVGLVPAGENGSWFQTVGMVEQTLDENASNMTFNGGASGEPFPVQLREDAVLWSKKQDRNEINWQDSELVFVGYGVVAPEYGWNDYEGLDVEGKTVVMLVNDPGYAREDELFNGKAMTYYGLWTYKFEEAGRQGATGAIIVHETAPASHDWEVVANSWSGTLADLVRSDGGADRTMFEAWISEETARALFADAGLDFTEMKIRAKAETFTPIDMGEMTVSGALTQTNSTTESRNVVGMLRGNRAPDEYTLFTAHWDHLGKISGEREGEPPQDFYRDHIFNGAVDNATGTAAMIEIAEAMANHELERSALFLAVTLEESGLLGSAYYAENPTVPMNQIVAGLNIDALLPIGRTMDMIVVGYGASELEDLLKEHLDASGRVIVPDPNPEAGYFYRSDHVSFAKKGVPMLYADSGLNARDGGVAYGQAVSETYRRQRYHKPKDEYSKDWDLAGMVEDVTALYVVGMKITQSDQWPTWYPGNEFEAIRQASLAERES
ncbi:MAG: M28 family metallopeptidase [Pseudomonadota bacterium]